MANRPLTRLAAWGAELVDRSVGWSRLPTALRIPLLVGLRALLLDKNLYDTERTAQTSRRPAAT